jgi:DNA-binding transcriptional LysR family regulator
LSAISSDIQALELRFGTQLCRRGRSGFDRRQIFKLLRDETTTALRAEAGA